MRNLLLPLILFSLCTPLQVRGESDLSLSYTNFLGSMSVKYPKNWNSQETRTGITLFERANDITVNKEWLRKIIWLEVADIPKQITPDLDYVRRSFAADTKLAETNRLSDFYIPSFSLTTSGTTVLYGTPALYWDFTAEAIGRPVALRHIGTVWNGKRLSMYWRTGLEDFKNSQSLMQSIVNSWSITPDAHGNIRTDATKKEVPTKRAVRPRGSASSSSASSQSRRVRKPLGKPPARQSNSLPNGSPVL